MSSEATARTHLKKSPFLPASALKEAEWYAQCPVLLLPSSTLEPLITLNEIVFLLFLVHSEDRVIEAYRNLTGHSRGQVIVRSVGILVCFTFAFSIMWKSRFKKKNKLTIHAQLPVADRVAAQLRRSLLQRDGQAQYALVPWHQLQRHCPIRSRRSQTTSTGKTQKRDSLSSCLLIFRRERERNA